MVLSGISSRFRLLSLCERQVAHVLLTRSPLNKTESIATTSLIPFDLHVLGMPPAFVLSQDQTLKFNLGLSLGPLSRASRSKLIINYELTEITCFNFCLIYSIVKLRMLPYRQPNYIIIPKKSCQ